jgi:hypothetical protein
MLGRDTEGKSSRSARERGGVVTTEGGVHASVVKEFTPIEEEEALGLVLWRLER